MPVRRCGGAAVLLFAGVVVVATAVVAVDAPDCSWLKISVMTPYKAVWSFAEMLFGDTFDCRGDCTLLLGGCRKLAKVNDMFVMRVAHPKALKLPGTYSQKRVKFELIVPLSEARLIGLVDGRVDAAFDLVPPAPAARARVFAGLDLAGAGRAAD
jgi:hypothetical protein